MKSIAAIAATALIMAAGPGFAQATNEGKPPAPAPAKAAPLQTGGKPTTMKGGDSSGGMTGKKMKKKKHHR